MNALNPERCLTEFMDEKPGRKALTIDGNLYPRQNGGCLAELYSRWTSKQGPNVEVPGTEVSCSLHGSRQSFYVYTVIFNHMVDAGTNGTAKLRMDYFILCGATPISRECLFYCTSQATTKYISLLLCNFTVSLSHFSRLFHIPRAFSLPRSDIDWKLGIEFGPFRSLHEILLVNQKVL
jgi:hypothetical protein